MTPDNGPPEPGRGAKGYASLDADGPLPSRKYWRIGVVVGSICLFAASVVASGAFHKRDGEAKNIRGAYDELEVKAAAAHPMRSKPAAAESSGKKGGGAASGKKSGSGGGGEEEAAKTSPWIALPNKKFFDLARESAVIHQELTFPEEIRSPFNLTMQETILPTPWLGGHFVTRGYGSIPGPTIRVKPGETLQINMVNNLGEGPGYESCQFDHADLGFFMNPATICALNHTNIHTHGLHVSATPGGDSIFNQVAPNSSKVINVEVPSNHMAGTHWYHPHLHHATAAQAGGGAHGAIIVDDPPNSIPKYVEDMPERMMFLSLVNVAKSMRLEAWGLSTIFNWSIAEQKMWKNPTYPNWSWSLVSGTLAEHGDAMPFMGSWGIDPELVVNGQWKPKMTIDEGKWHRFRFVFASIEQRVEVFPEGDKFGAAYCEFQLLAKDGIYLHDAPRTINRIYLVSGSRADVAVSCTCPWWRRPCQTSLLYEAKWEPMGLGSIAPAMAGSNGELIRIVTGKAGLGTKNSPELQSFSVRRPCYLADLRQAEVPAHNHHDVGLPQVYPMKVTFDGKGSVWGHQVPEPMGTISVGDVQEWTLSGIRYHPFHTHVFPFQVVQIWNDPYYVAGDWQDTMLPVGSSSAKVRLNIDKFTGKMIAHCHILEHEDNGMMGFVEVTGNEGDTWWDAHNLDPQCYDGAFPGPPVAELPPQWR